MRYLIKEKIFSLGDKFNIQDENGGVRYQVEGKVFSIGNKLKIYDLNGKELIYIEQKVFKFLPEYEIYMYGDLLAKVKQRLRLFRASFDIESTYGSLTVEGDVFGHDFDILKNGKSIASVSKKWVAFSDTYSVDIEDDEDQPFILALVIVLDQILYDDNRNR